MTNTSPVGYAANEGTTPTADGLRDAMNAAANWAGAVCPVATALTSWPPDAAAWLTIMLADRAHTPSAVIASAAARFTPRLSLDQIRAHRVLLDCECIAAPTQQEG